MEQAYKKLKERVFRRALVYVDDVASAEDIVQEVFLSWLLYQKKHNKRTKQTIDQAIVEACRKLFGRTGAAATCKGKAQFEELMPNLGKYNGYYIDESTNDRVNQLKNYYEEFLLTIFKEEKKLFLLRFVDGLNQDKIGKILGVSQGMINRRLAALKEKIKKFKERKDGHN